MVSDLIFHTRHRLTADGGARLSRMSLTEVADVYWPATQGWKVASIEFGWHYVLFVAEHREHGIAASLISTQPSGTFEDTGEIASEERWQRLDALARARCVRAGIYVQAANRLDVCGLYLDLDAIQHFNVSAFTMFGFLLESPVFMDDTVCTMTTLNPKLDELIRRTRLRWAQQSTYGVRPGGMLSPEPAF